MSSTAPIKKRCQRIGTCRFADDPTAFIEFDEHGERITPCPLKFEDCDKQLKDFVDKKPPAWKIYAAAAGGFLLLLVLLFAMTGQPSEEARRAEAAKQLKEIWPWLQIR
jgi:hypothetical protein